MRKPFLFLASLVLLSTGLAAQASAQQLNNDGFQRHNGQMHVLRNGQLRPMTHDARLPTGAVITKDGFLVAPTGKRTELREGQGCDLKGNLVAVVPSAAGGLALNSPAGKSRRSAVATPAAEEVRAALENLLGGRRDDEDESGEDDYEYDKKRAEREREQRKKEEEWLREEQKRREEHEREGGKKWKEKWKKDKKWDD